MADEPNPSHDGVRHRYRVGVVSPGGKRATIIVYGANAKAAREAALTAAGVPPRSQALWARRDQ